MNLNNFLYAKYGNYLCTFALVILITGCNSAAVESIDTNPFDPWENNNRKVHVFNKHIDKTTFKPSSEIYGRIVPRPIRLGVANFYENLQEPKRFANHLAQGELIMATTDIARFAFNSSVGIFGVFDVSSRIGLFSDSTDFDETFGYWGMPLGPYLELPFIGPNSARGSIATLTNYSFNPLSLLSGPAEGVSLVTFGALNLLNTRYEYTNMVDTVLYESADSYSSARSAFLQTRVQDSPKPMSDALDLFDPYQDY